MIRSPACIDALEDRIQSNVTHWTERTENGRTVHFVEANCSRGQIGRGFTPSAAVFDWLRRQGLCT